jgi:predicted TIM-barrel fold metal-dependent hydrolase
MRDIDVLQKLKGSKHEMIDCHVHIVNFLQETPGLQSLIEYMDATNIKRAVVFGLPVAKLWAETEREAPEYYLDDDSDAYYYSLTDAIVATEYQKLDAASQARLYPTICGFNPNDGNAIKHIERMYKMFPNVFCGVGETFFRHDDLTLLQQGEISRMNNRSVYPILEFCSEYQLPFLVHANVTTTWVHDYPKFLHELEEALRMFPKAPVVFCHCGISRRVFAPFYHQMVERLLSQYPALYVDFSWILYDEVICKGGIVDPDWIALTERFSDRIFLGSDVIGNFYKLGVTNARYDMFLDTLSPEALKNITVRNAERLYGWRKGRVEKGEKLKKPQF